MKLTVKGTEYNLKFGYKSFKNSGVLKEVVSMQKKIRETKAENEDSDGLENIEALEEIFDVTSKLVLAALQKNHKEFRADYSKPETIQECIDKVDDFLDDYMEEKDAMPITDLFEELVQELFNNGFLSKKSEKLEDSLTEQDATVVPTDHKQAQN